MADRFVRLRRQQLAVGTADPDKLRWGSGGARSEAEPPPAGAAAPPHNPQGILRIRRIREVQFMLPEFVDRMRGSNRQSAQPTGSRWNRALPGGG